MYNPRSSLFVAVLFAVAVPFMTGCPDEEEPQPSPTDNDPCIPESAFQLCEDHGFECGEHTVEDACGDEREIDCGDEADACEDFESCGAVDQGVCGCEAETDEQLCTDYGIECGPATDVLEDDETIVDSCQQERHQDLHCGDGEDVCGEFDTCGGGEQPGVCGCTPESDQELCDAEGFECGEHTIEDACGVERTVNCGDETDVCEDFQTCGEVEAGVCGCTPAEEQQLCDDREFECGEHNVVDNCQQERTIECGDEEEICEDFESCGGGPGDDYGFCGCTPLTDQELCEQHELECGTHEFEDNCQETREIFCGAEDDVCGEFETCADDGPEEQYGVCDCTAETDEELCADYGIECGMLTDAVAEPVIDACGVERTDVNCGDEEEDETVCPGEFETCGGGGEAGICGCTPTTCDQESVVCGDIEDGCGGWITCDSFCAEQVNVGDQHVCAASDRGTAKCWGRNDSGQLGVGDTEDRSDPAEVVVQTVENDPDLLLFGVEEVVAGGHHSCALMDDETVQCWGLNDRGQLGDGTTNDSTLPTRTDPSADGTQVIDAGIDHTCAVVEQQETFQEGTFPVNRIKCWGHNSYGQIGHFNIDLNKIIAEPHQITDDSGELDDWLAVDVAAGDYHTCGLFVGPFDEPPFDVDEEEDLDEAVWCWGDNRFGQIDPMALAPNYHDEHPSGEDYAHGLNADHEDFDLLQDPELIHREELDETRQLHLTAGADHTCIHDTATEETTCRGAFTEAAEDDAICEKNIEIFAGYEEVTSDNGDEDEEPEEEPVFDSITTTVEYCSILPDASQYSMFDDAFPLFTYTGDGEGHSLETLYLDQSVDTDYTVSIADSTDIDPGDADNIATEEISSGADHICARVEDHEGLSSSNMYCLGNNLFGQLGSGTNNSWAEFREVSRDIDDDFVEALQISMGRDSTCALRESGHGVPFIQCWGSNEFGQVGNSALGSDMALQPYDVYLPIGVSAPDDD